MGSLVLAGASCESYLTEDKPYYSWGQVGYISGGQASAGFIIESIELDLKGDVLRTRSFQVSFQTLDNKSFNSVLLWTPKDFQYILGHPPTFPNGTWDWTSQQRGAYWPLPTPPEKGATPYEWHLTRENEYPWDSYSLTFLFGFNRTLDLAALTSSVSRSPTIADNWRISQKSEHLGPSPPSSLVTSYSQGSTGQTANLSAFHDFYTLKISFVREFDDVRRGTLAFWVPSLLLLALLIVAFSKLDVLDPSEGLTLFVGIGMGTLPFIIGALQLLPPRLSLIEIIFYGEIAASTVFAVLILLKKKTKS